MTTPLPAPQAMSLPLPPSKNLGHSLGYTLTQIREYGQACREQALEEAAHICSHKAETKRLFLNEAHYLECAEAIRSLK